MHKTYLAEVTEHPRQHNKARNKQLSNNGSEADASVNPLANLLNELFDSNRPTRPIRETEIAPRKDSLEWEELKIRVGG